MVVNYTNLPSTSWVWGEIGFRRKELQDLTAVKNLNLTIPLNPTPQRERTILGHSLNVRYDSRI